MFGYNVILKEIYNYFVNFIEEINITKYRATLMVKRLKI